MEQRAGRPREEGRTQPCGGGEKAGSRPLFYLPWARVQAEEVEEHCRQKEQQERRHRDGKAGWADPQSPIE